MVKLQDLVNCCDTLLDSASFRDYAPNGLQVEGKPKINKLVTGVTASQALIDAAVEAKADALLVHHGFFWKGEPQPITGFRRQRIGKLIKNDISLVAYHLPLDAHPALGNNAQLARVLDLSVEGRFGRGKEELAMYGRLSRPMKAGELAEYIEKCLEKRPLHLMGSSAMIDRVAWCSGAAQSYIEQAYELGVDAFISGEVSESTAHFARESGVHYFASGHHATERYGVQALGEYLAKQFSVEHEYIDIPNPV